MATWAVVGFLSDDRKGDCGQCKSVAVNHESNGGQWIYIPNETFNQDSFSFLDDEIKLDNFCQKNVANSQDKNRLCECV
jgi:hypothetical protein